MKCEVGDCEDPATVRLHVPWAADEFVCAGHARVRSRREGVVADPLSEADDALPEGASRREN